MKNYKNEIIIGGLLSVLFAGAIFWFVNHEPDATLKIAIASLAIVIGLIAFVVRLIKRRKDIQNNAPTEDEFTDKAKLYASSKSFFYSVYLWFIIFIFNNSFTNNEEMLGIGILGSSAIYGVLLWYYKSTSDFLSEK
ncbi:MAG: hypothetical protein HON98_03530 [Chloroflexi bacterium]|jgi:hypothetical protein|nr:hypothetical protein [Chloroflexota bacterium]MBT3670430.1 hypothetical protein [Chloroflexota bacterium]MBT4002931.1 hypothetical protein [Chloroflexota bacterium]MBT4304668.1 hypothetical protein [Chloroflexota bacterium]MBT4534237.1 hypothetical protein [Chloroflexota bacterium]